MTPSLTPARLVRFLGLLGAMLTGGILLSLAVGSSGIQLGIPTDPVARDILLELRLPRTLAAIGVGGLLALAGLLQQILLRNPLADPYVLGTSGGASIGAIIALLAGAGIFTLQISAISGALLSTALVFFLGVRQAHRNTLPLLLNGVAIAALCSAIVTLLISITPNEELRGILFWLLGDLSGAGWQLPLGTLAVLLAVLWPQTRQLNRLLLGQESAWNLGVNTAQLTRLLYVASAVATAIAVTTAGMIGFIGLIIPHALRLITGHDLRLLLPASVMGGGLALLLADVASRTLVAPQQLPVGAITAMCGSALFLWLMNRSSGRIA